MPTRPRTALLFACAGLALGAGANAVPVVIDLGLSPGGTYSTAGVVSGDGNVVTGSATTLVGAGTPIRPFRWVYPAGPMVPIPLAIGNLGGEGAAINLNGSVIVGTANALAFRWTSSSGAVFFPTLAGGTSARAAGVSADGFTTAGQSTSPQGNRAVKWTATGVITNLGVLPGAHATAASVGLGISPDSSTVVGASDINVVGYSHAFRWFGGFMQDLGTLPTGTDSAAVDVSADNGTIVGWSNINFSSNFIRAMRYKFGPGMMNLGTLPGGIYSYANAVNGNGFAIVGRNYDLNVGWRATLWTPSTGMVDLKAYVASLGGNVTGWVLDSAWGVSDDGTAISGSGLLNGNPRAFLIRGLPCPSAPGWTNNPTDLVTCPNTTTPVALVNAAETPSDVINEYSWYLESPPGTGQLTPITGPTFQDPVTGLSFEVAGVASPVLEISGVRLAAHPKDIRFVPIVINPCGSAAATIILHVQTPCNLADIAPIGGTAAPGECADEQLTVDDVIVFFNLFADGVGCPGVGTVGACSLADVCGIGGPPEGPDGQLTVDDVIAFVNAFSDGC